MRIPTDIAAASVVTRHQQEQTSDEIPIGSVARKPLSSLLYISAGTKIPLPRDVFGWAAGSDHCKTLLLSWSLKMISRFKALLNRPLPMAVSNRLSRHQAKRR